MLTKLYHALKMWAQFWSFQVSSESVIILKNWHRSSQCAIPIKKSKIRLASTHNIWKLQQLEKAVLLKDYTAEFVSTEIYSRPFLQWRALEGFKIPRGSLFTLILLSGQDQHRLALGFLEARLHLFSGNEDPGGDTTDMDQTTSSLMRFGQYTFSREHGKMGDVLKKLTPIETILPVEVQLIFSWSSCTGILKAKDVSRLGSLLSIFKTLMNVLIGEIPNGNITVFIFMKQSIIAMGDTHSQKITVFYRCESPTV